MGTNSPTWSTYGWAIEAPYWSDAPARQSQGQAVPGRSRAVDPPAARLVARTVPRRRSTRLRARHTAIGHRDLRYRDHRPGAFHHLTLTSGGTNDFSRDRPIRMVGRSPRAVHRGAGHVPGREERRRLVSRHA